MHYATAEMTGSGDRFMGVKKWPGPLNRVIKCRYFKQRSELECASELYPHEHEFKTRSWKFLGQLFSRRYIIYASFSSLNGMEHETMNRGGRSS